jgi:Ca2+-transporting ATPase
MATDIDTSRKQPDNTTPPAWHILSADETVQYLQTDARVGLHAAQVTQRLARYGRNVIPQDRQRGPWRMLLAQFTDFMILVLIAAAVISGMLGELVDTLVILTIILLNAAIGFVQEYRAERAVAALRVLAAQTAHVTRDGLQDTLAAAELVPGDVVHLEAGNVVPADVRLIESAQLRIQEAALTGESVPAEKTTRALHDADLPLGDRSNMAYKGTVVSYGRGRALVIATGTHTQLCRIAALLHQEEETRTPLQRRLTRFGRVLALAVIALCVVMFVTGVMRGEPVILMALTAISLAVAAIPEALPAVVTISLALGAAKMVKKNALIRRLPAVETLGSVTYICSDKTGTLTQNRMRVEEMYAGGRLVRGAAAPPDGGQAWSVLFRALALSNDAAPDARGDIAGDPTEVALYLAAQQAGYEKQALAQELPRVAELPFDADRKCMTTLHRDADGIVAFVKGAPEKVLALARDRLGVDGTQGLDRAEINARMERMAADGLRVLAVATRHWPALPGEMTPDTVEQDLSFVGLVGLMDPPRPEALEAVSLCQTAGITPVMITGDHPYTARAIAARLGITETSGVVFTGQEVAKLTDVELRSAVEQVRVYARVTPEQKIRIVQALQDNGEFVAMTGDGVNDAPALRRANIGVAMGITGTDVAKEASHMILLDDNFATIVTAVREGRRIFDNIRKFIKYTMTSNAGEICTIFLAPLLGLPIPLLPVHILWINLVTDGLPGLALSVEQSEQHIMQRPPRPPNESIFAQGMWQHILWVGFLIGALCIFTQAWSLHRGNGHWQTMVFTVLTLSQMAHVLAIRSERESLFTLGILSNRPLLGAVALTCGLQLALIYAPPLNRLFRTQPLSLADLAFCLGVSATVFMAVELEKAWKRRRRSLPAAKRV